MALELALDFRAQRERRVINVDADIHLGMDQGAPVNELVTLIRSQFLDKDSVRARLRIS